MKSRQRLMTSTISALFIGKFRLILKNLAIPGLSPGVFPCPDQLPLSKVMLLINYSWRHESPGINVLSTQTKPGVYPWPHTLK